MTTKFANAEAADLTPAERAREEAHRALADGRLDQARSALERAGADRDAYPSYCYRPDDFFDSLDDLEWEILKAGWEAKMPWWPFEGTRACAACEREGDAMTMTWVGPAKGFCAACVEAEEIRKAIAKRHTAQVDAAHEKAIRDDLRQKGILPTDDELEQELTGATDAADARLVTDLGWLIAYRDRRKAMA